MHVLVTGATGFIGSHVVPRLLDCGHELSVLARDEARAEKFPWFGRVRFHACDIHRPIAEPFERFGRPDALMHLAWSGLPHYAERVHIEENLPANYRFLNALIDGGLKRLLVTGTCLEYGMQSGCLAESMPAQPTNAYAQAKDALRESLDALRSKSEFTLQWARLFYTYGKGQNPNSLLAQLDHAIDSGAAAFDMSGGEQLRDYLPVEEVAQRLVRLLDHAACDGIVNVCSGHPIAVLDLVKQHLVARKSNIQLNLGHYPYPDYEPMAFWGDTRKYNSFCIEARTGSSAGAS